MKIFTTLLALFTLCSAAAKNPTPPKIIGYFASWAGAAEVENVQYHKLTHINYSFIQPNSDGSGTLKPMPNPEHLKKLVTLAHKHNVKVGIAVGGWNNGDDSAFETLAADPKKRATFIRELLATVEKYQLDGVDMDWEYPDAGASADHFLHLMQELRTPLSKQGKFLSAAVVSYQAKGIKKEVFATLDMLNIMAYDGRQHSLHQQAEDAITYWTQRGCPKHKLILGLPFYGRAPYTPYKQLLKQDPQAHLKDQIAKIHYNGIPSIKKKCQLAKKHCAGVMIWELTQDTTGEKSLLKAIHQTMHEKN